MELCAALQMMPKEFEALIGLRRMQLGLDAHAPRHCELARLAVEDPVGHYYAQTPAERAPYQLQAAGVLFGMSGGDVSGPVAALTLMKLRREESGRMERKARALLLAGFRGSKARKEATGTGEIVEEEPEKGEGRRRVRFGGKE